MVIDAPNVEYDTDKGKGNSIKLTDDNADEVLAMLNKMNR